MYGRVRRRVLDACQRLVDDEHVCDMLCSLGLETIGAEAENENRMDRVVRGMIRKQALTMAVDMANLVGALPNSLELAKRAVALQHLAERDQPAHLAAHANGVGIETIRNNTSQRWRQITRD